METRGNGLSGSNNPKDMRITIDTLSLIGFQNRMNRRSDRLKSAKDNILKKSIFILEKYEKYYSPVDTGRMRASIGGGSFAGGSFGEGEGIYFGDNFASIGPTVVYAKYVNARTPFLAAAAQESIPEISKVATEEVRKAIE